MRLQDKSALITGSSQGIGAGIALRFAEEGANVVVNYYSHPEEADEIVNHIRQLGRQCVALPADLGQVDDAHRLVQDAIRHLGRLDILVNNAGIEHRADFWTVTEADYDRVLNLNLKGAFFAAQAFAQHLRDTKRPGKIINISSVHEDLPFPHFAPYCLSKGGMKMLTRTLAIELAPFGIAVNSIAPGAIQTPINTKLLQDPQKLNALLADIPLHRLGQPADVAGVAVFLASSDADYLTGTSIFVDGGLLWNYSEQ
jgi:glucose 1-dehydrogenase